VGEMPEVGVRFA